MKLKISTPIEIILEKSAVKRIVTETESGSLGILPQRLDCIACLVPGVLLFETEEEGERFIAVDEGILVKVGSDVHVCVRNSEVVHELGTMRRIVQEQFLVRSEQEKKVRAMLAKLESDFIRNLMELTRHG